MRGNQRKLLASALGICLALFPQNLDSALSSETSQSVAISFSAKKASLSTPQKDFLSRKFQRPDLLQDLKCIGIWSSATSAQKKLASQRAKAVCNQIIKTAPQQKFTISTFRASKRSDYDQVRVTFKIANESQVPTPPSGFVATEPILYSPNSNYQEGKFCQGSYSWQVFGLDAAGNPAFLRCPRAPVGGTFVVDESFFSIDPRTKMPLVPLGVPDKTRMAYPTNVYIYPQIDLSSPSTPISSGDFKDYVTCKIASSPEDNSPDKSLGFPLPSPEISATLKPNFKILVIPVQFLDHPTTNKPAEDMADVVYGITKFYQRASSVPISFDWEIPNEYIKINRTIDSFNLDVKHSLSDGGSFWSVYRPYIQTVIDQVDSQFDFSRYDAVIIEEPRSVTDQEHGMFIPKASATSRDGEVKRIMITGNDHLRDVQNWIHEFGHILGLSDRNWFTDTTMSFDLLFGWYGIPELSVWNRWLLGILQDTQIDCKSDEAPSTHHLQPVSWVGNYKKGVVIPLSDHEVLVAESRRRQGYDVMLGKESEGVIVYRVDTRAKIYQPSSQKPIDIVAPPGSTVQGGVWSFDVALQPGEAVTSDGWTIRVIETGTFGDVIKVERSR